MTDAPMTDAATVAGSLSEAVCPHFEDHTQCPEGYLQWHAWAEKMMKTHRSTKCAGCGLYAIWVPKPARRQPKGPTT